MPAVARPKLPGYVAISPTILQGAYAPPFWRLFYQGFADLEPAAVIGNSLRVYWVNEWPEPDGSAFDITVQRDLGEALLKGLQWPEHALHHYRTYVRQRPADANGQLGLGLALVALGQPDDALTAFRNAVAAQPWDGAARLTLARALLVTKNVPDAFAQVSRALELRPNDPDAHDLVGRIYAVAGQFDRARESLERALALNPSHPGARAALAQLNDVETRLTSR
jgi:tetratricopeptide (TPR) repeat protein